MGVLVGLDVGTTNWKAAAFTEEGKPICMKKAPTRTHYTPEGYGYYEPDEIWQTFCRLLRELTEECDDQEILSIAVTSMSESVVPINAKGEPCFPVIAWFDTRSARQSERLALEIGTEQLFAATGLDPNPIFSVPKILWIRENHPQAFHEAKKWLQMADYLNWRLCGAFVTDYTLASRTLAFDIRSCRWSEEILSSQGISPERMPELRRSGEIVGKVTLASAKLTGLPEGLPVVMGGHDHPCASLSAGVLSGTKLLDSSGTAESFLLISRKGDPLPTVRKGQRMGRYLDPERYVLWGGILASGASVDWGVERLRGRGDWGGENEKINYSLLLDQLEDIPVGSDGAVYLPHLRGSGAPDWDPRDRGAFIGLKSTHTARHMLRALLEGLACQARLIVEMEQEVSGITPEAICAVGGGTRLRLLQTIKANILQKVIEIPEVEDATVLGAALLGAVGVGVYDSIDAASIQIASRSRRILPEAAQQECCEELFRHYCVVNDSVCQLTRTLDRMEQTRKEGIK